MKILKLADIKKSMPDLVLGRDEEWPTARNYIAHARGLYGKDNVHYLTMDLALNHLMNKKVYAIFNQSWEYPATKDEKIANIELIEIAGISANSSQTDLSDADINFYAPASMGDEMILASMAEDSNGVTYYGVGSGDDPVIVFVKGYKAPKKAPPRGKIPPVRRSRRVSRRSSGRTVGDNSPNPLVGQNYACKQSSLKKYRSRPGPPYPAQDCANEMKRGNDGQTYLSMPDKNGVFRWKRI